MTEYRICWNAGSNASFHGSSDWEPWDEDGDPEDVLCEVERSGSPFNIPPGLDIAIQCSGFEWYVETRETANVT